MGAQPTRPDPTDHSPFATSRSLVVTLCSQSPTAKHGRLFLTAFDLGSGQIDGLKPTSLETALSSHFASFRSELLDDMRQGQFSVFGYATPDKRHGNACHATVSLAFSAS